MVYLPATSSEAIHLKAIDKLREYDFRALEEYVIHRLSKELELNSNIFKRNYITIHYTTEEVSNKSYNYLILTDNDDDDDYKNRSGCLSFLRLLPPQSKTMQFVNESEQDFVLSYDFMRHLRVITEFLLREENLRSDGIFRQPGSEDMEYTMRLQMQSSKYLDLDDLGCTAYDCANVLKQYLHEMTEPLFLPIYYPAYNQLAKMITQYEKDEASLAKVKSRISKGGVIPPRSKLIIKEQKIIDCLQLIIQLMPQRRREVFSYVLEIVEEVYKNRAFNRMSGSALGAIFAPLVLCPRGLPRNIAFSVSRDMSPLMTKIIRVGREVFSAPLKLRLEIWKHVLRDKNLDDNRPSIAPIRYY